MVSVIVTVGPDPAYKKYLLECLASICNQDIPDLEIVLVDDAAHLGEISEPMWVTLTRIKNVWNLGQACSINIGIAHAKHDLVFVMGGSDDKLEPTCLQECLKTYEQHQNNGACYSPTIITSEGEISNLPQGVWMLHRSLWAKLGGYPREAAIGEVDSIFCSMMLAHNVPMIYVKDNEPLYWHREHDRSLTHNKSYLRHDAAALIRSLTTTEWHDPTWRAGFGYK